jgi:hypothetical protein
MAEADIDLHRKLLYLWLVPISGKVNYCGKLRKDYLLNHTHFHTCHSSPFIILQAHIFEYQKQGYKLADTLRINKGLFLHKAMDGINHDIEKKLNHAGLGRCGRSPHRG